jgi:hypothetical protein
MLSALFGGGSYEPLYSYEDVENMLMQYFGGYIEEGDVALQTLAEQYTMLLNDPAAMQAMLGAGFEESPGYQYQYEQAMNAANQSAAAGGMLGTPAHAQQSMGTASGLAQQDYANYYNRNANLYGQGLSTATGINQMGYQANAAMAGGMGNYMGSTMTADYKMQASQMDALASLLGMAAGGASAYASGGSSLFL